tara:strand:- start:807 stop:1265 length:459 start_codon:yes stop_codon:yes gene_type:complete
MSPHLTSGYMYLCSKYEHAKKAKEVLAKDKSFSYLFYMILSTLFAVFYMMFISYIQSYINSFCIKKISKNKYEITLFVRNKLLKFRVFVKGGPSSILQILDKDNKDITKEIEPYFNTKIESVVLDEIGIDNIDVYMSDGKVRSLMSEDILQI